MKTILTAARMKAADQNTIEKGVPSLVLMERAALSVVHDLLHKKKDYCLDRTVIFCGTGNNAGDGVAIGRILKDYGYEPVLVMVGKEEKYSEAMKQQVIAARNRNVRMVAFADVSRALFSHATLMIDAIFGIGLTRDIQGIYAEAVQCMNEAPAPKIAVDIPSGIHTDTGRVMGCAVQCERTVTFARAKRGMLLYPGAQFAGSVAVKEIGIPVESVYPDSSVVYSVDEGDLSLLPERDEAGNKGTFKKILVIAGSKSIFGAAALAAEAALRSGAGMVKVFTDERNRIPLCSRLPEALISTYSDRIDVTLLESDMKWADGMIIGPGLGTSETAFELLEHVIDWNVKEGQKPVVFDADALNLLAVRPELMERMLMKQMHFPAVFTPHMGEMSRLTGFSIKELKEDPIETARSYAKEKGIILVLKDARTVIADPEGICWLSVRGNSGLATAGSGDVLAGIMGALVTQNPALGEMPALAVLIHALAGEHASEKGSKAGVAAGDLLKEIPAILPY